MRLIDADELKERAHEMILEDSDAFNGGWSYDAVTVEEIDESPTVDAVPVVRGEWLKRVSNNGGYVVSITCSVCGYSHSRVTYNFCPNCGADMRGEK